MPAGDARGLPRRLSRRAALIALAAAAATAGVARPGRVRAEPAVSAAADPYLNPERSRQGIGFAYLNARPFEPLSYSLFGSPPAANAALPLTDAEIRAELRTTLGNRPQRTPGAPSPADLVRRGEGLYDNAFLRGKATGAPIRAAIALLLGTVAEDAIEFYFSPVVAKIGFADNLPPGHLATTRPNVDGTSGILVASAIRYERPVLLSHILAHEALHGGDQFGVVEEEIVAFALHSLVHLQQLRDLPGLAETPTALAQLANYGALARLNGGDGDRLRIIGDHDLLPFVTDPNRPRSYASLVRTVYGTSVPSGFAPATPLLQKMLARLAEPGVDPPRDAKFDDATIRFIDENLNWATLSPLDLVEVARRLDLRPMNQQEPPAHVVLPGLASG